MIKERQIHCSCGAHFTIRTSEDCSFLSVYCHHCKDMVLVDKGDKGTNTVITEEDTKHTIIPPSGIQTKNSSIDEISKIGPYRIVKKIGAGGMGQVLLGIKENTEEKVAIKLLASSANEKMKNYFRREAKVLMKLRHDNIVVLKDEGTHNDRLYLVMEYIEGKTLKEYVNADKPLSHRHAMQAMYYVLEALEYVHNLRIIHRDIKPENILVDNRDGVIKLIDMGLGKIVDDTMSLTKSGSIMGTAYYMPPEQITETKNVDARADIYAVGATLYFLLSGKPPYSGFASSLQIFCAKMQNSLPPLAEKYSNIPKKISQIVAKAMAHLPQDRYQTATAMKQDVMDFWETNS